MPRIASGALAAVVLAALSACSSSNNNTSTPDAGTADAGTCAPGTFVWGTSGGGAGQSDAVTGIAVDKQGNVWATGTFIGDAKWGDIALTAADKTHTNGFVAKLDPTGKVLLARVIGGAGDETNQPARLRLDQDGNAYIVGTFTNHFTYDSTSVMQQNAGGGGSAYVLKVDPNGKGVWAIQSTGAGSDENGNDVAIDSKSGDVFLVGSYNGEALFQNGTVITTPATGGEEKAFVAKYSQANTRWEWAHGWIGPGNDGGVSHAVVVGPDDSVTIVGQINGSIVVEGVTLQSDGGSFLVKLAAGDGHMLWVTQIDGGGQNGNGQVATPHAATVDGAGNLYITGGMNGMATFEAGSATGPTPGTGSIMVTATDNDVFLAKFDPMSKPVWVKHAGLSTAVVRGDDVAFDGKDQLYVSGFKQGPVSFDGILAPDTGNLFVANYDTSGAIKHVTVNVNNMQAGGEGFAVFAAAPGSGVFVGGSYDTETTLGTVKLTSAGQDDALAARLCY